MGFDYFGQTRASPPSELAGDQRRPPRLTRYLPGAAARCPRQLPSPVAPPAFMSTDGTASAASSTSTGMRLTCADKIFGKHSAGEF